MNRRVSFWTKVIYFGLCHLIIDGIALSYIFSRFQYEDARLFSLSFIIYNLLLYVTQPLIGLLIDSFGHEKIIFIVSLSIASIIVFFNLPLWIVSIIFGLTSSLIHVSGASFIIQDSDFKKVSPIGVYIGFGSIGTLIGTLFYVMKYAFGILGIIAIVYFIIKRKTILVNKEFLYSALHTKISNFAYYFPIFILIITVIIRGFIVYITPPPFTKTVADSFIIYLGLILGKCLGGFIADRIGIFKTILFTFIPTIVIFTFFMDVKFFYYLGTFLLSVTLPITFYLLIYFIKEYKVFAFGLNYGFLVIGTFNGEFGANIINLLIPIMITLSTIFLIIGFYIFKYKIRY